MNQRESRSAVAEAILALRAHEHGPSAGAKARVSSRLGASIAALGAPLPPSPTEGGEPQSLSDPPGGSAPHGMLEQLGQLAAPALSRTVTLTLTAFAMGGLVGAAVYASVSRPAPEVVYVDRLPSARPVAPSRASAQAIAPPAEHALGPEASPPVASARRHAPARRSATRPEAAADKSAVEQAETSSLAEQQALLDKARAALSRGQNAAVLDTLEQHVHRYPESALEEERETLAIKALIAAGRHLEARERGARFKKRFPNSLLLPSVSDALGRIP